MYFTSTAENAVGENDIIRREKAKGILEPAIPSREDGYEGKGAEWIGWRKQ